MTKFTPPNDWKVGIDFPQWANNEIYFTMIKDYLYRGESPNEAYSRVSKSAAENLGIPELEPIFNEIILKNYLCLASPVLANAGTKRGLPISCFGVDMDDDTHDIGMKLMEIMMMSKYGGGVASRWDDVRGAGSPITDIGTSDGTLPFIKMNDVVIEKMKQGQVRTAAGSANLSVRHKDFFKFFLPMRRGKGDITQQIQKLHHSATIPDEFMEKVENKEPKERKEFLNIIRTRIETGESFIFFQDNANKVNPPMYKEHKLSVKMTNICTEIMLHTDKKHSFVCCLSSLNIARYKDWCNLEYTIETKKFGTLNLTVTEAAIFFLDGIMTEFIEKAKLIPGFENSVRFAEKSRALGLGALGYHSFLIQENLPFTHFNSLGWTKIIFGKIQQDSKRASAKLAKMLGEPEWCKGYNVRNTHTNAIAPTVSNSLLSGAFSPNTEPYKAVYWNEWTAKGMMSRKNPYFVDLLKNKGKNIKEIWDSILNNDGSVQHLNFLSDWEKEIYKTQMEIDQMEIVKHAAERQKFIDQGMSLNLSFPLSTSPKRLYEVHFAAWKLGIKSLYYLHSNSALKADSIKINSNKAKVTKHDDCLACDG